MILHLYLLYHIYISVYIQYDEEDRVIMAERKGEAQQSGSEQGNNSGEGDQDDSDSNNNTDESDHGEFSDWEGDKADK